MLASGSSRPLCDPSQFPQQIRAQQQANGNGLWAAFCLRAGLGSCPSAQGHPLLSQSTGMDNRTTQVRKYGGCSRPCVPLPSSWSLPGTCPTVERVSESYRQAVNVLGEEPYLRHSAFRRRHLQNGQHLGQHTGTRRVTHRRHAALGEWARP